MRVFDLMNLELKLKIYFISSDKNLVTLFHKLTKATSMGRFYFIQWCVVLHCHTQSCFPVACSLSTLTHVLKVSSRGVSVPLNQDSCRLKYFY